MDQEAALLAAIAAHPEEDTPRLAYADWLDEHAGSLPDPVSARIRAEFIRVQCEIKRLEALSRAEQNRYIELYRRQDAILTHHRRELLGPLGEELAYNDVIFDRGFPERLQMDAERFVRHSEAIANLKPLPEVSATGATAAKWFLDCPQIDVISALQMDSTFVDPGEVDPFTGRWAWRFTRLRKLDLEGCEIGDLGLRGLADSPNYPALTDLDVSYNEISDDGVRLLVNSPLWPRLKHLVLGRNPISDEGARTLAGAAGTSRLEYLNLKFTGITSEGHRVLLRGFPRRTKLDLF